MSSEERDIEGRRKTNELIRSQAEMIDKLHRMLEEAHSAPKRANPLLHELPERKAKAYEPGHK
jgi:hypothetical protein